MNDRRSQMFNTSSQSQVLIMQTHTCVTLKSDYWSLEEGLVEEKEILHLHWFLKYLIYLILL